MATIKELRKVDAKGRIQIPKLAIEKAKLQEEVCYFEVTRKGLLIRKAKEEDK